MSARVRAVCLCLCALCAAVFAVGCAPLTAEIPGTQIRLSGKAARADDDAVRVSSDVLTISAGGEYVLRGDYAGRIVVDAGKRDDVTLTFAGASITAQTGAALSIRRAGSVTVYLHKDTVNRLTGGETPAQDDPDADAALYSKADLRIAGEGALTVEGRLRHGISGKDDLVIDGGDITVGAVGDGLRGKDSVVVTGGKLAIAAGEDGVKSNNDEDGSRGYVRIGGGDLTVVAGEDGVQAETDLFVTGGVLAVEAGKDALRAGGDMTLAGGDLTLAAEKDGAHAKGDIAVRGGSIRVTRCREGLEGMNVTIDAGTIDITASDDGINGAGGRDDADGDRLAQEPGHRIAIRGGEITIVADSDAIDCNGDIEISGGTLDLTTNNPGRATKTLDADGDITITGGEIKTNDGAERG